MITQQITDTAAQLDSLVQKLNELILALPENPRIRRINEKCFVIRQKDLGDNWMPEHHDFRFQYRGIVDALKRSHDVLATLRRIIADRRIKLDTGYIRLHPDVIENLTKHVLQSNQ